MIDQLNPQHGDMTITEGEIDKLSCVEAGIRNVVSVPTSDNEDVATFLDRDRALIDRYRRVIIATDADKSGRELADSLIAYFGSQRCWIVAWPDGCNDANDVLMNFGAAALAACITAAQPCSGASGEHLEGGAIRIPTELRAAVERLAKLSPLGYDQCRQEEARELEVRVAPSTLRSPLPDEMLPVRTVYGAGPRLAHFRTGKGAGRGRPFC